MNWNVEELRLMKEKNSGGIYIGREYIFPDESSTIKEDKIKFVDNYTNGILSYILFLTEKLNIDKADMPKDNWGSVKTTSFKAWLKKNDNRNIIDNNYKYGKYYVIGCERWLGENKGSYDTYDNLVDELFHRQLKECLLLEEKYFKEHDEFEILKKKIEDKIYKHNTSFNLNVLISSSDGIKIRINDSYSRPITFDEAKVLSDKYDKLEKFIEELSNETVN